METNELSESLQDMCGGEPVLSEARQYLKQAQIAVEAAGKSSELVEELADRERNLVRTARKLLDVPTTQPAKRIARVWGPS